MLQGSLDNFALDEVLGLLASTSKTGTLEVKGDRGVGALGLRQGQLVGATASNTANGSGTEDIVFELMRFAEGTFVFTPNEVEGTDAGRPVPDVLASAESRLVDWRTIEAVVPSLSHTVSPVPALPAEEIMINRREWSTLIVIGSGCPVSAVCTELDLGEVEGSRQIKDLAERGLVSVGPPLNKTAATGFASRSAAPVDPAARPVADPFARKAEQSTRRMEPLTGSTTAGADDPSTGSSRTLVGAAAGASRPPMPAPPTAAELRRSDAPAPAGRGSIASVLDGGNGNGNGTSNGRGNGNGNGSSEVPEAMTPPSAPVEPSKPSGLLMRYLKGED